MANLYELTGSMMMLQRMLEDGEIDKQVVVDTMESLGMEIEDKAEGYAMIIKNLTSDTLGLKAEEDRLYGIRKSLEGRIDSLKRNLEASMLILDKKSFKTPLFTFSIQRNQASLKVEEFAEIPKHFYVPQPDKLDSVKLKEAINNGLVLEGVTLEQSESLRIR